jgi:hypothetical protein
MTDGIMVGVQINRRERLHDDRSPEHQRGERAFITTFFFLMGTPFPRQALTLSEGNSPNYLLPSSILPLKDSTISSCCHVGEQAFSI